MTVVDPQLNQIPRKLLDDPDLRDYFENLERYRHDMWQRTGGPTDEIEASDVRESYPWPTTQLAEETQSFVYLTPQPILNAFNAVTVTSNYTMVSFDFVNAKSGASITLPKYPNENGVIIIRNGDGTKIKFLGNGKKINGSTTGSINREGTAITMQYFIDSDEWFAR